MKSKPNSVVVRMCGGLGNQLFQMSASLYVAKKNIVDSVDLDCRFLDTYETPRNLEIGFLLKYIPNVNFNMSLSGFSKTISRLRIAKLFNLNFLCFSFINSSAELVRSTQTPTKNLFFLDGYFQDPILIENVLDREYIFRSLARDFAYLFKKIESNESKCKVALHIRRGDFITSKSASKTFKTVELDYYRQAIKKFPKNIELLVFGDDPKITALFAKEISGINIGDFKLTSVEEFTLLAMADHYIIANSTFSWWASYLGYNNTKRVIAPRNWYVDKNRSLSNPLLMKYFELLD